jgi:hypothetical protein
MGGRGKSTFTAQPPWWPAAGIKQWGGLCVEREQQPGFKATRAHTLATAESTVTCLGAGAGLGRTRGRAARMRPAIRWTPSGRSARYARRGGILGPRGPRSIGKGRPSLGTWPGSRGVRGADAAQARRTTSCCGAAPSSRSNSLCPGSDAFISKILN